VTNLGATPVTESSLWSIGPTTFGTLYKLLRHSTCTCPCCWTVDRKLWYLTTTDSFIHWHRHPDLLSSAWIQKCWILKWPICYIYC